MIYEAPPPQEKLDPLKETYEGFISRFENYPAGKDADRFFIDTYLGFSPTVARELVCRAGAVGRCASETDPEKLYRAFSALMENVRNRVFVPYMALGLGGEPEEFSYTEITYLPGAGKRYESFSELLSAFYGEKRKPKR